MEEMTIKLSGPLWVFFSKETNLDIKLKVCYIIKKIS